MNKINLKQFQSKILTPGGLFRKVLSSSEQSKPLQILGTVNAYCAKIARKCGVQALYLSGSGVATASFGLPDLGLTNLSDVCEDARRITASVSDIPLLVDIDTGLGQSYFEIQRTISSLIMAGVGAVHIEDQVFNKRCGHRQSKKLVSIDEMKERLIAIFDFLKQSSCRDKNLFVIARTDSLNCEGLDKALERCQAYLDCGADALFIEAITSLEILKEFKKLKLKNSKSKPKILCNITEFGVTPLYTVEELRQVDVDMVLYPLSAHRAMSKAAEVTYKEILKNGTQRALLDKMQTREQLYKTLDYEKYEKYFDEKQKMI